MLTVVTLKSKYYLKYNFDNIMVFFAVAYSNAWNNGNLGSFTLHCLWNCGIVRLLLVAIKFKQQGF